MQVYFQAIHERISPYLFVASDYNSLASPKGNISGRAKECSFIG